MADNVKVAVRVRPFNQREQDRNARLIIDMQGTQTSITNPEDEQEKSFNFDYSYWSHDEFVIDEKGVNVPTGTRYADQRKVFDDVGRGVLDNAFNGFNSCLFAYGQTGSGKSYSMVGYGNNKGIIPISCEELFNSIAEKTGPLERYEVTVSMLEIYNEQVRDLLNPKINPPGGLKIRENPKVGVFVDKLTPVPCTSYKEVEHQMEQGTLNRTVASTQMNATSSRAHTVFTVQFHQIKRDESTGKDMEKSSKINLVDLAGSERVSGTGASGDRLKEGANINKSLTMLGNVISALAEKSGGKKGVFVPYRNSALTRLLQDALGGNSKTIMIAALSPAHINYDETLSTLRYADRAKQIKNAAVVNENPTDKLIRELREENEKLKKLMEGKVIPAGGEAGGPSPEEVEKLKVEYERQQEENKRMMEELEKSWQQKLEDAKKLQEQQEKESGHVSEEDRDRYPHIINMNEDPLISNRIVHILKEKEVVVGREGDIKLKGLGIEKRHCILQNDGGKITVAPLPKESNAEEMAAVYVNGKPIKENTKLELGDRIIFNSGTQHTYRYIDPVEVNRIKAERDEDDTSPIIEIVTWNDAQDELAEALGLKKQVNSAAMQELTEEDIKKKKELEDKVQQLQKDLESAKGGSNEREAELMKELEKMKEANKELEESRARRARENERVEDEISDLLPLIQEANAIAKELQKPIKFEIKLVTKVPEVARMGPLDELKSHKQIEIGVNMENLRNGDSVVWTAEKFNDRLYMFRDLFERMSDVPEGQKLDIPKEEDPFWDPPEPHLIGNAHVYLKFLYHVLELQYNPVIIDYRGKQEGELRVEIYPVDDNGEEYDEPPNGLEEWIGKPINFDFKLIYGKGLTEKYANNVSVEFQFFNEPVIELDPIPGKKPNPEFNFRRLFKIEKITKELVDYLQNDAMTFKVKGYTDAAYKELMEAQGMSHRPSNALGSTMEPPASAAPSASQELPSKPATPAVSEVEFKQAKDEAEKLRAEKRKLEVEKEELQKEMVERERKAKDEALATVTKDGDKAVKKQIDEMKKERDSALKSLEEERQKIKDEMEKLRQENTILKVAANKAKTEAANNQGGKNSRSCVIQ
mmetsp:Transcript_47391/g.122601  ORF Transcript_47391/g.122601 Transcript_47391/m.122601 type:complete len:1100 (-) Transcript_47391:1232-4531(-)